MSLFQLMSLSAIDEMLKNYRKTVTAVVFISAVLLFALYMLLPRPLALEGPYLYDEGFAWHIKLPRVLSLYADTAYRQGISPLRLTENGNQVSNKHCSLDAIRQQGKGCYSHWAGFLYFSTPDGSNPNSNSNVYRLEVDYNALLKSPPAQQIVASFVFAYLVIFLVAYGIIRERLHIIVRRTGFLVISLSFFLAGLNVWGEILGEQVYLKPPAETMANKKGHMPISSLDELDKKPKETDKGYFARLNARVHEHMVLVWQPQFVRTPITENYLLYVLSYILPNSFAALEFVDPELALERRYSICSQSALVVHRVLAEQNFETKMVSLDGHVVASATSKNGDDYILDPYADVIVPYGMNAIEANPNIVSAYYTTENRDGASMPRYFEKAGNTIFDMSTSRYLKRIYWMVEVAYFLKWLIPLVLFAAGVFMARKKSLAHRPIVQNH